MGLRRIAVLAGTFAGVSVVSIGLWLAFREPIGRVVRQVTATAITVSGGQVAYPPEPAAPAVGQVAGDKIGIVMTTMPAPGQRRTRSYGVSLMRWHVNLIVLPALVMTLGNVTLWQRLVMLVVGIPLLVVLDGCSAFVYLVLGARRTLGDEILSPAVHANLEHALAVYVAKLLPVVVWGALYILMRAWVRRTGTGPAASS